MEGSQLLAKKINDERHGKGKAFYSGGKDRKKDRLLEANATEDAQGENHIQAQSCEPKGENGTRAGREKSGKTQVLTSKYIEAPFG